MSRFKVLVCGGRDHDNQYEVDEVLDNINLHKGPLTIIQGDAYGADREALSWAQTNRVPYMGFPAQWQKQGKAAGMARNKQMLEETDPDYVVAFPTKKSIGTWGMIKLAKEADKEVYVVGID